MDRRVRVEGGLLSGRSSDDGAVAIFRGIPYAAPPVGPLRWRPPQAPAAWDGVRPALEFGARCPQPSRNSRSIGYFGPEPESEDCLTLNIWTASPSAGDRRPVLVWFHPGAFYLGSGAIPLYDGTALARQGLVVVTVNFRLGKLGFLAHPWLTQESPDGVSGNYGLLDQIAALHWLQRNVAAFGGAGDRVTIAGQSAGATSVSCLMAAPRARGLFHRAIGMSSGAFGPVTQTSGLGESMQSLAAAEHTGTILAAALGAQSLDALRTPTPMAVQRARPTTGDGAFDPASASSGAFDCGWPIMDGHVLPDSVAAVFASGRQSNVPLLTGSTANEGATMPRVPDLAAFRVHAKAYAGRAEAFEALYPATTDEAAQRQSAAIAGHKSFDWQNWAWARLHARAGLPTFYYQFTRSPPIPADLAYMEGPATAFGAFHGADIPYAFQTLSARAWAWGEVDRLLSERISGYWVAFAQSGDPNGDGRPHWRRFDPADPQLLQLDAEMGMRAVPHLARLAFWDNALGSHG